MAKIVSFGGDEVVDCLWLLSEIKTGCRLAVVRALNDTHKRTAKLSNVGRMKIKGD